LCTSPPDWNYEDSSVDLSSGDRMFLFTDGITEMEDSQGVKFGVERVAALPKLTPRVGGEAKRTVARAGSE